MQGSAARIDLHETCRQIGASPAARLQRCPRWDAGPVIVNHYSAYDVQIPQMQFYKGKSFRSFGPVGPYRCLLERAEFRYDLRHICGTLAQRSCSGISVPMHVVREILGHTSVKTTERYAHVMVGPQREALSKLGELHERLAD